MTNKVDTSAADVSIKIILDTFLKGGWDINDSDLDSAIAGQAKALLHAVRFNNK